MACGCKENENPDFFDRVSETVDDIDYQKLSRSGIMFWLTVSAVAISAISLLRK